MATTFDRAAEQTHTSTSSPTVRFRRVTGAGALPLSFTFLLVCNVIYAWVSTESGLSDSESSAEALEFYGRYPDAFLVMTMLVLIGVLVMIPGLLAALRVLRPARPRLALSAITLMMMGYVSYFGIAMTNFDTLGLAQYSLDHPDIDATAVLDSFQASPAQMIFFVFFLLGNLVGTLLLGLAVMLSRDLPAYAGVLIMCWTIGHVINIVGGGEWYAVAGGALEIVGLGIVAATALRTTDAAWASRG